MPKQYYSCFVLVIIIVLCCGCTKTINKEDIVNKTFIYEKGGSYGDFGITINDDGTFTYYEGSASSYIGNGKWEIDGSTNFIYITLKDGAVFHSN